MHGDGIKARTFLQPAEEALVILLLAEDQLAVVAALDDMVRLVGQDESGKASHSVGK
jgi:hypothetical protein